MDWLTFIASILDSLAWPATVLLTVFILRDSLGKLIPGLNALKYKDLEFKFGRDLKEIRSAIEPSPKPTAPSAITGPGEIESGRLWRYYESIAELSPRAAMLEAWIRFETTATSCAQQLKLLPEDRRVPLAELIQILETAELITQEEAKALAKLRAMRNDVIHDFESHFSKDQASEYVSLVTEINDYLVDRAINKRPRNC